MLRTGYKTEAEQDAFYRRRVQRAWYWRVWDWLRYGGPRHRYYALDVHRRAVLTHGGFGQIDGFFGVGGLTYLSRWSRQAEISLIISPECRGMGLGEAAVDALLEEAHRLGLTSVIGECYPTGNLQFWTKRIVERPATLRWEWKL
jgi:RimJ/RimL family protein N-acetyltransferase